VHAAAPPALGGHTLKGFILAIAAGAIAFLLLLQVLPSSMINIKGELWPNQVVVALAIGVVNAIIKPVVTALSFPISLLTLGLSGFVINAALLMAVAWGIDNFTSFTFTIGGWPAGDLTSDTIVGAVVASVLLSIVTAVIGLVVRD
jgi:putative membrane protein